MLLIVGLGIVLALIGVAPAIFGRIVKNKIIKAVLSLVSLAGWFGVWLLLGFIMSIGDYLGYQGVLAMIPVCAGAFILCLLFIWKPFSVKMRRITTIAVPIVSLAVVAGLVGPEIYHRSIPQAPGEEINLHQYLPFGNYPSSPDTLVASLAEPSTLRLTSDLPRLDGATALYPLYSAFTRASYPQGNYNPYAELDDGTGRSTLVGCAKTSQAYLNLLDGRADIVFLMGVSDAQKAMAASQGLELTLTPIGREAFVFFVNAHNSISGLTSDDVKGIYSGQITNWRQVGGKNDDIKAYQRPEESGSQTMLIQIMGTTALVPAPEEEVFSTMMGMYTQVANYKNYKNSLGYSFLYYINDMINENKIKFLSIDGVAPTRENISDNSYPYSLDFYAVTVHRDGAYLNPERGNNIDAMLSWIQSPQGQYLVDATGYVPLS